jgi:hypothetical protein
MVQKTFDDQSMRWKIFFRNFIFIDSFECLKVYSSCLVHVIYLNMININELHQKGNIIGNPRCQKWKVPTKLPGNQKVA